LVAAPESVVRPLLGVNMSGQICAVAIMAKASVAGTVKTRLVPPLSHEEAAELNTCCLADVAANIAAAAAHAPIRGFVAYHPLGSERFFDNLLPAGFQLLRPREPTLGRSLFHAARDLFAAGYGAVCLINADSPTLPTQLLVETVARLREPGDRIVLGPAADGGYYLIGLKRFHRRLFEGIDWSTERVYRQTIARADEISLAVASLPEWYDVDDNETLALLARELQLGPASSDRYQGGYPAPSTTAFLEKLAATNGGIKRLIDRASFPQASHRGHATGERGGGGTRLAGQRRAVGQGVPTGSKLLPLLGGLLLAGGAAGLAAQFGRDLPAFIIVVLFQSTVWAAAALTITRVAGRPSPLKLILTIAILLRLVALAAPVFLSDDINRYIWDGRVQAAGINPYRYIPTDPDLAPLRDEAIFPSINRNNYAPTIYPPCAQMLFLLANRLGGTVLAVKLVFVAIEAVGVWALLFILRAAGMPRERILLYAWHPLPVWEIAGSGHVDGAVVGFVALGLAAAIGGRRAWSGAALAAATLVKFLPLVLAPALWRPTRANLGDWRWLAAFIAVIIAAYLPYLGVGSRVVGFVPGYVAEENLASGTGFWVLEIARRAIPVPLAAYLGLAIIIIAGLAVGALRRRPDPKSSLPWATVLEIAALFLMSPHYAWYFVSLVALLTAAPWWPAWWLTLTAVLLYLDAKTGHVPILVGFMIYGGFVILCCVEVARRFLFGMRSGARHGTHRAI
jgi:alpha-1,6-mannosyltransferase